MSDSIRENLIGGSQREKNDNAMGMRKNCFFFPIPCNRPSCFPSYVGHTVEDRSAMHFEMASYARELCLTVRLKKR
jgi:hypothetical protein